MWSDQYVGLGLVVEESEVDLTRKGHEGSFWGDRNVPYLDRGDGYVDVLLC